MFRFASRGGVSLLSNSAQFSTSRTVGNIDFIENNSFLKVILNRPKALNSLNLQMIKDLTANIPAISANKAYWIEGVGGKAFCAGGDVKALFEKDAKVEDRLDFFRHEFTLDYKLSQVPALEIANWDGIVMGGGFGISAFASFRIATENTMFAMP
jgi:enoyl-CoA hydratase/carnithine racemase